MTYSHVLRNGDGNQNPSKKVQFLRGQFLLKSLVYQEGISRIIL